MAFRLFALVLATLGGFAAPTTALAHGWAHQHEQAVPHEHADHDATGALASDDHVAAVEVHLGEAAYVAVVAPRPQHQHEHGHASISVAACARDTAVSTSLADATRAFAELTPLPLATPVRRHAPSSDVALLARPAPDGSAPSAPRAPPGH